MDNRKITEVDEYIVNLPEDIQEITNSVREIILNASLKLEEEYKWSMPNYSYNGLVCYLQASKKHVNLGFHNGNERLEKDRQNVLEVVGKTMRYVKIKKMDLINPDVFNSLINDAIKLNDLVIEGVRYVEYLYKTRNYGGLWRCEASNKG